VVALASIRRRNVTGSTGGVSQYIYAAATGLILSAKACKSDFRF
jgi:hypothetical protein